MSKPRTQVAPFTSFFLAFCLYLSLAIGGIGLGEELSAARLTISGPLLIFAACLLALRGTIPTRVVFGVLIIISYCVFQLFRAEDLPLALRKLDGFLFASCLVLLFGSIGLQKDKVTFYKAFIVTSLIVLAFTVVYKLLFGFWNRDVRFFLNGPIVYGWMMSILSLLTVFCALKYGKARYYVYSFIFLLALFWTNSKGPIIGWFAGAAFLMIISGKLSRFPLFLLSWVLFCFAVIEFNLFPDRFAVIGRLLTGTMLESDFGSIGIRQLMFLDSLELFYENSLVGLGLGNWATNARLAVYYGGDFVYPHNILAELLSEHGLIGCVVFISLFVHVFRVSSELGKTLFVMMLVSLQFTGDMGYWHFLIALPMIIDGMKRPPEYQAAR